MMYSAISYLLALSSLLSVPVPPVLSVPTPSTNINTPSLEERYYPQGLISSPANGTIIMPGETFDFFYNQRGDYCLSSMNFSVWLFTSPPAEAMAGVINGDEVTGWYFGRFAYSGVSNQFPKNPAPSQLTMPDFSKPMGGFSAGESVSNMPMYFAVMEEWNSCSPTVGHQLSFTANQIVYNATNTSSAA